MGLIKCPDCGNMVSERAESCPSCGCPVSVFKPDFRVLTAALLGFHLLKCMDRKDLILAGDCVLSDQRYDEFMEMLHERRERRRDFTRGVLKTAAGVALGNKISDKLKNKD